MHSNKKIGVIGYGWLGKNLLKELNKQFYDTYVFSKNSNLDRDVATYIIGDLVPEKLMELSSILVLVPPRIRHHDKNELLEKYSCFAKQLNSNTRLVYSSSTSVYAGIGQKNEDSECEGTIFEIENIFRKRFKNHLILRLGGLAGPERTIVNILQKKGFLDGYNAPSNLLHLNDAVNCLLLGIEKEIVGTYNLCSPNHPSKITVYNAWNQKLSLPLLSKGNINEKNKLISSEKWILETDYTFLFQNPIDFSF